jgi:DNA-binding response OmpR family regulator
MEHAFPAKPVPIQPTAPADSVLLVEDDENIGALLKILLGKVGLQVRWVQFGHQALEEFTGHRESIRLIICDGRLPDMDGRDVCLAVRRVSSDIPVLLTSGHAKVFNSVAQLRESAIEFLAKPYAPAELIARVHSMLAKAAQASVGTSAGFV